MRLSVNVNVKERERYSLRFDVGEIDASPG